MANRPPNYDNYGHHYDERQTRPIYGGSALYPEPDWQPPRRSPWMSVLLYGLLGLAVLIAGAVVFVLVATPTDLIRKQIIAEVRAKTGRDLTIAGPTSLTFYPALGLSMDNVTLSAPPTMGGRPFVTMAGLDVSVRLLPLLASQIAVESLVLRDPVFELRVDGQGRKSWEFAAADRQAKFADAGTARSGLAYHLEQVALAPAAMAAANPDLGRLELGEIRIENGTIRYTDERAGASHEVNAVDAAFALKSITSPFTAKGSVGVAGERVDFDGTLTTPQAVLENRAAKLALSVSGRQLTATYSGSVTLTDAPVMEGDVTANVSQLRALATAFGAELPSPTGFNTLDVKARVKAAGKVTSLSDASFVLDGATATGNIVIDSSGARPAVNATLRVSELDLNKYLSDEGSITPPAPTPAVRPPSARPQNAPDEIEKLLRKGIAPSGPQVKGYTKRAGWSEDPIDLVPLGLVDADAKLTVGRLLYHNIKTGQSLLTVAIKNKVMRTTFDDIALYNGRGKGVVTVDGTTGVANVGATFTLDNIAAQPLLTDAAEIDWMAGSGKLSFAVAGQGKTERQVISTLNGKSSFSFIDGAIVGINIPQSIRGLAKGEIKEFDLASSEKTDFSEMSANFTITNGVAENSDLKMLSPLLRVGGAGKIMLAEREIDYTVRPKLVASLSGQGGEQALSGLEIPVRITGSLDNPDIGADLGGILKDGKVGDAIKEIGKELKGKNAGEVVEELFGKGKDGQKSKAQNIFEKLFK